MKKQVVCSSLGGVGYISHVHRAYNYSGPFGVLWIQMAWNKDNLKKMSGAQEKKTSEGYDRIGGGGWINLYPQKFAFEEQRSLFETQDIYDFASVTRGRLFQRFANWCRSLRAHQIATDRGGGDLDTQSVETTEAHF